MDRKVYESPRMEIVPLEPESLLAGSGSGDFGVSGDGNIGQGNDDVWDED